MCVCLQVTIKGCTGPVNTFVIEPFVPHKEEFYLCIQSNRLDIEVCVCVRTRGSNGHRVWGLLRHCVGTSDPHMAAPPVCV